VYASSVNITSIDERGGNKQLFLKERTKMLARGRMTKKSWIFDICTVPAIFSSESKHISGFWLNLVASSH
jgi:hypothetical protein